MKLKKTRKSKRQRGNTTYGHGARKKWKGSGHRGGKGMAGTGKRADQKKTLINKLYGNKYFGKQGITSRGTARKKGKTINLRDIQQNIDSLLKKFGKAGVLNLEKYKVLGEGELKTKLTIKAKSFSESAKMKIEKIGGKIITTKSKDLEIRKKVEKNSEEKEE